MSVIHVADQTFIMADPHNVRKAIDYLSWQMLWPNLECIITQDRGDLGIRWKIAGPIEGTMELWLQLHLDGVMLHFFIHGKSLNKNQCAYSYGDMKENYPRRKPLRLAHHKFYSAMPMVDIFRSWFSEDFFFRWDQHGVRRNARRISFWIKNHAENLTI